MAHVREALTARDEVRAATAVASATTSTASQTVASSMPDLMDDGALMSEADWEASSDLMPDIASPIVEEYDYSGLPDDVPLDDDAPYVYDDMSASDADLNTGV